MDFCFCINPLIQQSIYPKIQPLPSRHIKLQDCSLSWFAVDFKSSAELLQSRAHIPDAIHFVARHRCRQAAAVVGDRQVNEIVFELNTEPDFRSAGVPDDVRESFFEREKQLMPMLRVQGLL